MKILLRKATITDPSSPFNGLQKDILIDNGSVADISDNIFITADKEINAGDLVVSPGWVDIFAHFPDPGFEYRETLESGSKAAVKGGYTTVFTLPNNNPVTDNKSTVEYVIQKSRQLEVDVRPLGAVTKTLAGKDLAEMYDMYNSGAVAFSDGLTPVQSAGLLLKALQYVKSFNGVVVQLPVDKSVQPSGLMNEGVISTRLGLQGAPAIAEELMLQKLVTLLEYTNSRLHVTGISTAKSIEMIKSARARGLDISCSVTPAHLFFCDEDLQGYDTLLKLDVPLRTREDRQALREAVLSGFIDCIASHHIPHDEDSKQCEFEYAKPGMNIIEHTYQVVQSVLPQLSNEQLCNLLSNNARKIFNLQQISITPGKQAEFTLFSRSGETTVNRGSLASHSANNPFIGKKLNGKVIGIIREGKLFLN